MFSAFLLLLTLLQSAQPSIAGRTREQESLWAESAAGDAIDVCGDPVVGQTQLDTRQLEPIVTTNRGQKETWKQPKRAMHPGDMAGRYPYHLPNEVLILCHKDSRTLGEVRTVGIGGTTRFRAVSNEERADLFGTLTKDFVHSPERRTPAENSNFLFVVDSRGNLLVAPVMQGDPPQEVKHGDLTPGQTPISRPVPQPGAWPKDSFGDHAGGNFRGVARLGGEFDLISERERTWIVHQKSGYSLSRIKPSAVAHFELEHPDLEENDVWETLGTDCFHTEPMIGIRELDRFYCYMRSAFGVDAEVQSGATCFMGSKAESFQIQGNRPRLDHCTPVGDVPASCQQASTSGSGARLTLVEWLPPLEDTTCSLTVDEMTQNLEELDAHIQSYSFLRRSKSKDDAESPSETSIAKDVRSILRALKRSPCWKSADFAGAVRKGCPLSSCLGEVGIQTLLKELKKTSAIPIAEVSKWWASSADIGMLPFWNARCVPVPQKAECTGLKPKYDHKCMGRDKKECGSKKKCYWPPDAPSDSGLCLGHKFKDDRDCLDYRSKAGCDIDSDCFWSSEFQYKVHGHCLGQKYSDDMDCSKYRTIEACRDKSDCFFQRKEGDADVAMGTNRSCQSISELAEKKAKPCQDYRELKCLKEVGACTWQ